MDHMVEEINQVRNQSTKIVLKELCLETLLSVALLLFITQTTSLMSLSENKKHEEGGEVT
jgi:hypothetical protein